MKFKIQYVRSIEAFAQSIEVMRKINLESLPDSIVVRSNEKSPQLMLDSSQSIKTRKTKFSPEFSINYSECLKRFQALWMVL